MASELRRAGFDTDRLTTKKHYEIPTHAVADSAAFDASPVGLSTMAAAYHDAWLLTSDVAAREPGASPPRCWPHHFDLATLITLITLITLPALRDAVTRTIGVGVSPGDASYPEPYVYVGPYPKPDVASLPRLARGHWHTDGWVGAVLTMPDLIVFSDGAAQALNGEAP